MPRYLRIAAAVVFALLAVGFVALWVRSYHQYDTFYRPFPGYCRTYRGIVDVDIYLKDDNVVRSPSWPYSYWHSTAAAEGLENPKRWREPPGIGFALSVVHSNLHVMAPHWFLTASSLGFAALFAFKRTWRYNLRTILVATTLLAGLLGLAVYAV